MKKNKIGLIIVIVLALLAAWFIYNNKKGTIKETLRDFAVADTASVTKIFLADKDGNQVKLERQPSGIWTVNEKYNARMDAINMLLMTMKRIDIKEPVGKVAQDNVIKRLAAKAVKCEIFQNGELTKAYYVGTETADQTGTYMILIDTKTMQTSAKPFVTYIPGFEGYLTTRYFTKESDWRDRTVYSYVPDKIKSIKLEVPYTPEHGYELIIKGNNDYVIKQLSNGKEYSNFDTVAVKQYLSYFQNIHFETMDVMMKKNEIDSALASKPINILTITDESGKVNVTKFFPRKPKKDQLDVDGKLMEYDPERMNALLNEGDFVVVQYYVFGKLMPPADYFLKKIRS
ncbi:MAG: hypothetical protein JNL69_05205 [Bacteroidia bacterium]|nr:hypothetical protein [Bacteroidia bacterium]